VLKDAQDGRVTDAQLARNHARGCAVGVLGEHLGDFDAVDARCAVVQQTLGGLKVGVDRRLAAHGFDEFFGNLYHLNAEEEPESPDCPTEEEAPLLRAALLPRGVIHSWVTDTDTDEVDPRYGPVGKQRVEDTGPLNRKRMETIDDETTAACVDFIRRQHASGTPFSCG